MLKESKALEISCYVLGAGAFGIFCRWMQDILAYNDDGLVDASFWNVAVVFLILAAGCVFYRFLKKRKDALQFLPADFCSALKNEGKIFQFARIGIGLLMVAGAGLLAMKSETDKNASLLLILSVLGALTGVSFPFLLASANRPAILNRSLISFLSFLPILFYCIWLLSCYKENSINPVGWDYFIEILTLIFLINASFRIAGFAFGVTDEWKSMFFSMMSSVLCMMNLADERYLGLQFMFAASALMYLDFNWIILSNLKQGRREVIEEDDGFEYLN